MLVVVVVVVFVSSEGTHIFCSSMQGILYYHSAAFFGLQILQHFRTEISIENIIQTSNCSSQLQCLLYHPKCVYLLYFQKYSMFSPGFSPLKCMEDFRNPTSFILSLTFWNLTTHSRFQLQTNFKPWKITQFVYIQAIIQLSNPSKTFFEA